MILLYSDDKNFFMIFPDRYFLYPENTENIRWFQVPFWSRSGERPWKKVWPETKNKNVFL